jgi:hypothetical protein
VNRPATRRSSLKTEHVDDAIRHGSQSGSFIESHDTTANMADVWIGSYDCIGR